MNIHSTLLRANPDEPKLGWMLLVSFIIHLGVLAVCLGSQFGPRDPVYFSPVYTVSLVGMPGPAGPAASAPGAGGAGAGGARGAGQDISLWKGPSQLTSHYKPLEARTHTITIAGADRTPASARSSSAPAPGAGGQAGSGAGAPGQAAPSAAGLRFSRYYEAIWNKIQAAWVFPRNDGARRQLEAVVMITIARDGKIIKTQFEKRSGDAALDRSVLRAIQKADPLPPLPAGMGGNTLELGIRFVPGDMR